MADLRVVNLVEKLVDMMGNQMVEQMVLCLVEQMVAL